MPWRYDVNDQDFRKYLAQALANVGEFATYTRLNGGTYNTGIQVRLQDGRDVVVKISPPKSAPSLTYESDLLPTEADYYLRTRPLGVPVPEVLAVGTDVFPGRHHLVMSRIPGRTLWGGRPAPNGANDANLRRQLGRIVAQTHQAHCDGFGYMFGREQLRGATWPDAFERMIGVLLDDAARFRTELPLPPAEIRRLVSEHRTALAKVSRPVLVHFDLWDGNILISGDGTQPVIAGIIDGERALHGDPAFEFPSLTVLHGRGKDPGYVIDKDFSIGYCEINGPMVLDRALLIRLALYRTYLYMVMLIEITPREIHGADKLWRQTEGLDIVRHQLRYLQGQL